MDLDIINVITGFVSAFCAVIGLVLLRSKKVQNENTNNKVISLKNILVLIIISSGWFLSCISYLLVFEPYGSFITSYDYKNFYGWLLSFPAIIILSFGLRLLTSSKKSK